MSTEESNALPPAATPKPKKTALNLWPWLAAAAIGVAGWQWWETRHTLDSLRLEVAQRLAGMETADNEDRGALKLMREEIDALQGKLGAVEGQQEAFQGQADALQSLYQELARSREEASLIEVEQAITLAGQQLQLVGNVPAAVLALQSAENRLQKIDRPQVVPLRKAIAHDLTRLSAVPVADVAGMNLRIEKVLGLVDQLPFADSVRPQIKDEAPAAQTPLPWWERSFVELWQEFKGLIRIQRFDRLDAPLLAPGQGYLLRENLKLRLLNARLAMLAREQEIFRGELKAAGEMLARYFDDQDKAVQEARAQLAQLQTANLAASLPDLNETQTALRHLRGSKEKK